MAGRLFVSAFSVNSVGCDGNGMKHFVLSNTAPSVKETLCIINMFRKNDHMEASTTGLQCSLGLALVSIRVEIICILIPMLFPTWHRNIV